MDERGPGPGDGLIEQFRGRPNIAVFQKALARQLSGLRAFYSELSALQWLDAAEGAQLDGIGDIVRLSRADALAWARAAGLYVPMDDGLYRLYLHFKIFLNASAATYADAARTIAKFWPDAPFEYSEDPEFPATMFFASAPMPMTADISPLRIAARVKAAGVALHFVLRAEPTETADFHFAAASGYAEGHVLDNPAPGGTTETRAAASANIFMETGAF